MIARFRERLLADERGSNAAEIVIIAPVIAMLILVHVAGGRITVKVETSYSTMFVSIIGINTLPAEATATAEIITQ